MITPYDKLIVFFMRRWKYSYALLWVIFSLSILLVSSLLAWVTGEIYPHGKTLGLINDTGLLVNAFIGDPSVLIYYLIQFQFINRFLAGLENNKIIKGVKPETIQKFGESYSFSVFVKDLDRLLNSKMLVWFGFALSLIFTFIALPFYLSGNDWRLSNLISLVAFEVFWTIIQWLFAIFFLRLVIFSLWLVNLFKRFDVNLYPKHPDKAGGLKPLSQYILNMTSVLLFLGAQLSLNQLWTGYQKLRVLGFYVWTPDIIIPWIIYLFLFPSIFVIPTYYAHQALQKAKDDELLKISNQFDNDYYKFNRQLKVRRGAFRAQAKKLAELDNVYKLVESSTTWPFNVNSLVSFFATILFPLMFTIISDSIIRLIFG